MQLFVISTGNYCPVCHQCYSDDDWDVKMIQCESCFSWVHAKCEQINGECVSDVTTAQCESCFAWLHTKVLSYQQRLFSFKTTSSRL